MCEGRDRIHLAQDGDQRNAVEKRYHIFGFYTRHRISRAERLLSSQEGLCFIEVMWLVRKRITVKNHSTKLSV